MSCCFNSNLVRLKGYFFCGQAAICIEFQFQSGAIESLSRSCNARGRLSFNSNLVRLKVVALAQLNKDADVSIPIWCD